MNLKNKVVLVTGSSRGIGKAIALLFAKNGAKVVVNYSKSEKEANEVVKEINKISESISIKCDVSDEKQVKNMIDNIVKRFGRLDVLINNAGIVFDIPLFEKTVEQWDKTLGVNLIGMFLCSKYAVPYIKKQKSGVIINIASTNGLGIYASPDSADYDASKAGVISLTKNLASELAPNIRVNCIAPGWVNTDINKDLPKDYITGETERILLKRFGEPEEIGKAVLFLASDDASFITGTTLIVDGGYDLIK